jgi:hypothetical protein
MEATNTTVRKYTRWTAGDLADLRKEYGVTPVEVLADRYATSVSALREFCRKHGIKACHNRWAARDAFAGTVPDAALTIALKYLEYETLSRKSTADWEQLLSETPTGEREYVARTLHRNFQRNYTRWGDELRHICPNGEVREQVLAEARRRLRKYPVGGSK